MVDQFVPDVESLCGPAASQCVTWEGVIFIICTSVWPAVRERKAKGATAVLKGLVYVEYRAFGERLSNFLWGKNR